jgi:leucyl aminopeptidase
MSKILEYIMSISILSLESIKNNSPLAIFVKKGELVFSQNWLENFTQSQKTLDAFAKGEISGIQTLISETDVYLCPLDESKGLNDLDQLRLSAFKSVKHALGRSNSVLQILASDATQVELLALIEGAHFALYSFEKYKTSDKKKKKCSVAFVSNLEQNAEFKKSLKNQKHLLENIDWCRDLVNEPGSSLTPQIYVKHIEKAFETKKGVTLTIRDHKQLHKEGFNGLLTVGAGGNNPPMMVTLEYRPKGAQEDINLGFVGKGVTFDTGGISIKPAAGMWEMRMDMAGSATTLAAFKTIVEMGLKVNVVAVVCLTENRPGQNACLPGDIFKAKNGKTIMVDNTDAEGRLILTDGLWEAGDKKATHIVDLATLTGAIIRALGYSVAGLFANNQILADKLIESGHKSGEKFWQMPLEFEYSDALEDKVADYKNIGGDAGAITAALFLNEFVPEGAAWAHLDIAGTAFSTKEWKYFGWGATGWGVRALVNLAEEYAV